MGENATLGAYKEVNELVEEGDEETGREAEDDW